jgi:hypothetical protein
VPFAIPAPGNLPGDAHQVARDGEKFPHSHSGKTKGRLSELERGYYERVVFVKGFFSPPGWLYRGVRSRCSVRNGTLVAASGDAAEGERIMPRRARNCASGARVTSIIAMSPWLQEAMRQPSLLS